MKRRIGKGAKRENGESEGRGEKGGREEWGRE